MKKLKFKLEIQFSEDIPFEKVPELLKNTLDGLQDKADYSGLAPEDCGFTEKIVIWHQNIKAERITFGI